MGVTEHGTCIGLRDPCVIDDKDRTRLFMFSVHQ